MRNKPCMRTAVWTMGFLAFLVLSGACDKVTTYSGGGSQHTLTISKSGVGSGTITSVPSGINCGATCSAKFTTGAAVTLTTVAVSGSYFAGWSGGVCSGAGTCAVAMSSDRSVTAAFSAYPQYTLSVSKSGAGGGTVTSSPSGISCGATCSANFTSGAHVVLSAAPDSSSSFSGWSGGGCSGTGTCTVAMSVAQSVTAAFSALPQYQLTLLKSGAGTGTVSSSPSGISCGGACTASFTANSVVTLTAAADAGFAFTGWSGACSGTGTCSVTMSAAQSVTAVFSVPPQYQLTLYKSGSGTGAVSSSPSGINCGAACYTFFTANTVVTLSAAAATGSTFAGWSGACSGTGQCVVTMSAAQSVTATFAGPFLLSITKAGAGTGTVTSFPAGIDCGATCSVPFPVGTPVTLDAAPDPGSTFTGWSGGGCFGTGACSVTMSAAQSVTATFGH